MVSLLAQTPKYNEWTFIQNNFIYLIMEDFRFGLDPKKAPVIFDYLFKIPLPNNPGVSFGGRDV